MSLCVIMRRLSLANTTRMSTHSSSAAVENLGATLWNFKIWTQKLEFLLISVLYYFSIKANTVDFGVMSIFNQLLEKPMMRSNNELKNETIQNAVCCV